MSVDSDFCITEKFDRGDLTEMNVFVQLAMAHGGQLVPSLTNSVKGEGMFRTPSL